MIIAITPIFGGNSGRADVSYEPNLAHLRPVMVVLRLPVQAARHKRAALLPQAQQVWQHGPEGLQLEHLKSQIARVERVIAEKMLVNNGSNGAARRTSSQL